MAILTEEQVMLRDAARGWVSERSPVSALRKLRDGDADVGFDRAVWAEMGQMGWAGVVVPEAYGGSAFGYRSLGLVLEETGRTLTNSPLVSTALFAASVLTLGGSAAQKDAWLAKVAEAAAVIAPAIDEHAHHAPASIAMAAEGSGDGWTLSGKKPFVLDGMAADALIVAARTSGSPGDEAGITLFLVPAAAQGLDRARLKTVDSRGAADVAFHKVAVGAGAVIGQVDQGFGLLDQALDRTRAGLAAEMLGQASQAFEITLDYLKTRVQFGQVIGTFQSLQHRAAKMFTELEMTRSCVEAALDAIDAPQDSNDPNALRTLCSLAKARACETVHLVSNEMVQMHGGIGMTDAHDAGLYMKRARVSEALFGGARFHRDRYATLMGY